MVCNVYRGIIHGNVLELDRETGIADGERVEVVVRRLPAPRDEPPGSGFLRTEGALAEDTEWDEIMEEIQRDRKRDRRSIQRGT